MPETKEENEKRLLRELEGKNIAHFQTLLAAWIQNRMERDKTVITLSVAGIGLLVTILTTVGTENSLSQIFAMGAVIGFIVTIWIGLKIYELNDNHIESSLRGENKEALELKNCDLWSKVFFSFGIICMILFGFSATIQPKGEIMSEEKKSSNKKSLKESLDGLHKMQPKHLEGGKSLQGLENLKPENSKPSSTDPSQKNNSTEDKK